MKNYLLKFIFLVISSGLANSLNAQIAEYGLLQQLKDDSTDVNTLAMYSHQVRENIFKAATHPEGIVKLNDAQNTSRESFKNLLAPYSKDEQNKIWNLMRYEDLVSELAVTKEKRKNTEKVLQNYPADIREDALEYNINHHDLILSIDRLNVGFNKELESIISTYPDDDKTAFRELIHTPDALSLLNKNMHMTVHLGDLYKNNPALLSQEFESLNIMLAEENAREKEEWKTEMQQDPEAQKEMEQSAQEYANENGYDDRSYSGMNPNVVEHYVYVPYPYWCGYPWWYAYDYWYPYPYWYHTGFYYWYGDMIWIGPPSWYFMHWHFYNYQHFYDYPYITNTYINHYYYGPRRNASGNTREVHAWMGKNETSLPTDFKTKHDQRINRIREFGKSEIDRQQFNQVNPGKNMSHEEFIKQHKNEYPHLKQPAVIEQPIPVTKDNIQVKPPKHAGAPPVREHIGKPRIITQPSKGNEPVIRPPVPGNNKRTTAPAQVRPPAQPDRKRH